MSGTFNTEGHNTIAWSHQLQFQWHPRNNSYWGATTDTVLLMTLSWRHGSIKFLVCWFYCKDQYRFKNIMKVTKIRNSYLTSTCILDAISTEYLQYMKWNIFDAGFMPSALRATDVCAILPWVCNHNNIIIMHAIIIIILYTMHYTYQSVAMQNVVWMYLAVLVPDSDDTSLCLSVYSSPTQLQTALLTINTVKNKG